ncbi:MULTISPECIES: TolC family protein [Dyadobacter]|uniref:TolC family protein n=1 Tax=Dyadobacter psychrotolerans TaxID=2541721 RepID=A0A4R5DMR7_9BACT|nr:TolC family protein [Dyadobacter psychrotolerans]TDE13281.1 TolC family protein [Dyadobacter psychrotolerans]
MSFFKYLLVISFLGSLHPLSAQRDLTYYTSRARENSPLVNDNVNLGRANLIEVERLKAFYTKPQIGVVATYLFAPIVSSDNGHTRFEPNSNSANRYFGYDIGASNGGQYLAQLTLTQPLFNEPRARIAGEQFKVSAQINQNLVALSGHDVEKLVTDQYILCQQDLEQIRYLDQLSQMLPQQRALVRKLVESSIYKQSDLSLLNLEYENMLAQLAAFRASYRRDLMDLNVLSGINDTTLVNLQPINLQLAREAENSVFLEKYKLDSANLAALQNVFELKYKPQLNLNANAGLNAIYAPTIPRRLGASVGLTLVYPLFDGHQKGITRNKTQVLQKSVSFSRQNFINQNTVRKAKILAELGSYGLRESLAQQQLAEYETLLNTYKKEILTGQLSIIIYLTTLKNRAIIQRDYALLSAQKQILINAYNYWNW